MREEKFRVWYAPEDLKAGRKVYEQIEIAINIHDKILLVLSKASMSSSWVQYEIRKAVRRENQEKRRILFPIRLVKWDDIKDWVCRDSEGDLADVIREYHIPDFSGWKNRDSFESGFVKLIRDLRAGAWSVAVGSGSTITP